MTLIEKFGNSLWIWNVAIFEYEHYGKYEVSFERDRMSNGLYEIIMHVEFGDDSLIRHVWGASQHFAWCIDEDVTHSGWKNYLTKWSESSEQEKRDFIGKYIDGEFDKIDKLFDDLPPELDSRKILAAQLRAERTECKRINEENQYNFELL